MNGLQEIVVLKMTSPWHPLEMLATLLLFVLNHSAQVGIVYIDFAGCADWTHVDMEEMSAGLYIAVVE